jgi:predicted RND superfamily exporter protein
VIAAVCLAGVQWLRVDTNQINFFAEDHPLSRSAAVIDRELSGIYSFNVMLEGPPDSLNTPDALQRMEALRGRLQQLPFVRKVVSLADYVKRVNRELHGGDPAAEVLPASAEAVAQELFVFGLSGDGRAELARVAASDYSRAQISVKLASMSSDLVFEQINRAEEEAREIFSGTGITATVTGSGRMFSTLDHYLVTSQISSFGTAFITVFAVIFVVFRSFSFGFLGIVANALPVCAVLGLMGWLDISLNVATIMVSSVALGIVDDDTIHFIGRFRREVAHGAGREQAITLATMHEGRASLTTAIINSMGYGVLMLSAYKPTAWFGGLLALTMVVAFLAEVFVVPAVITTWPRAFRR